MLPAFSFTMTKMANDIWYFRWNMLWAYVQEQNNDPS